MEGMVFKNKAIVTAMSSYSFQAEDRQMRSGVSIEFLMTETLTPSADGDNVKGIKSITESLDYDKCAKFISVPGLYELSFKMVPGKNKREQLKAQLKVIDADFVGELSVTVKSKDKA